MEILQQILFIAVLGVAGYFIWKRTRFITRNIGLGKTLRIDDHPGERWKNTLLIAFGQKKMFVKPLVGVMHFVLYAGFILINIEILEILIDGIAGTHRVFAPFLGNFYPYLIGFFEWLAVGVIVFCVVFLLRRNVVKIKRLNQPELNGFPRLDANIILFTEIVLMLAILTMNAADAVLQENGAAHYAPVGRFAISQFFIPMFENWDITALMAYERVAWWLHILGILAFAVYLSYSKHLHIVMSFPNTYYSRLEPKGEINNMAVVTKEVKSMLGIVEENGNAHENDGTDMETPAEPGRFGAKDINDLTWKQLMDAYSCTECGRCTAACPANITGKKLSPRKIMMDTRDRMEEVGRQLDAGQEAFADGKSLLDDYITREELLACTTCNACVEACPVSINPLDIILDLRRYMIMEESKMPQSWAAMNANIENNMAPWKFSPSDRFNWADKLRG
jgi:heterodisulfide reductase subunit C